MNKNKKRSENFTAKEERLLLDCVKQQWGIIENKRTDAVSNDEKMEAWKKVALNFNTSSDRYRDFGILKNKFTNMKKKSKKAFAEEKLQRLGTGGGEFVPSPANDIDVELKELLGKQVTGLCSQVDDDASDFEIQDQCSSSRLEYVYIGEDIENIPQDSRPEESMIIQNSQEHTINEQELESNEKTFIPGTGFSAATLRRPVSTALKMKTPLKQSRSNVTSRTRPRDPLKTKLGQWAHSKTELVDLQKMQLQEEHDKKMQYLEKKWNLDLQHMKEEHELKMKLLKDNQRYPPKRVDIPDH